MLLKGKIKLKAWEWLLKKDQVSEENTLDSMDDAGYSDVKNIDPFAPVRFSACQCTCGSNRSLS